MTFSDETLMAFVDGELDAATSAVLDTAIAKDPELAARVERQRTLRLAVYAAFEPVLQEPMPARLLDTTRGAAATPIESRGMNAATVRRGRAAWPLRGWTRFEWGAIAASIALGVFVGAAFLDGSWGETPVSGVAADLVADHGQLLARGTLARALSEQLTSAQASDAPVRIGLTFVSTAGEYCRTFALERTADVASLAGLACKRGGEWRVQVIAQGNPRAGSAGDYRAAAAGLPTAVLYAVKDEIQGDALDAEGESAAQQRGWTR